MYVDEIHRMQQELKDRRARDIPPISCHSGHLWRLIPGTRTLECVHCKMIPFGTLIDDERREP